MNRRKNIVEKCRVNSYFCGAMEGFKVRKAAQVVAFFAKAEGGAINLLKLVKLVYLADRRFMEKYDCPILNDRFVSMDHGPVNSMTLNFINGCEDPRGEWNELVADRAGNVVALADQHITVDDLDELSDAEVEVLNEVWRQFRDRNGFYVRDYTHENCPEWEDPHGSSTPIPYERVLKFLGKKHSADIAECIERERSLDRVLAAE